jgi:ketosteroid isomerase-like protein
MVRLVGIAALGLVTVAAVPKSQDVPRELAAMAETEREFARTATIKGWRDAFLDFFADDAIAFAPAVVPAKDRLRKQPSTPFSEFELIWEPRTGDVADSGDLGWLTGPSTSINHKSADKKPRYGCYLSVWRKQPDGKWRVFIDVGADAPEPVSFAPDMTRTTVATRYAGGDGKDASGNSLRAADRALNEAIADQGFARAFSTRLTPVSRLHRSGTVPLVGPDQIVKWLDQSSSTGSATDTNAESASSGDFGYSYGTLDVKAPKPQAGAYVRLWNRDAMGRWWLMADVAQAFKER